MGIAVASAHKGNRTVDELGVKESFPKSQKLLADHHFR